MTLSIIRLELARDQAHPDGSRKHGYEFVAPLDGKAHIDAKAWLSHRKDCRVRRFWQGEADEVGHLVHLGAKGDWAFHYDIEGDPDLDEPGYRFGAHAFKVGEYVSLTEQDGTLCTFRVTSVRPRD